MNMIIYKSSIEHLQLEGIRESARMNYTIIILFYWHTLQIEHKSVAHMVRLGRASLYIFFLMASPLPPPPILMTLSLRK